MLETLENIIVPILIISIIVIFNKALSNVGRLVRGEGTYDGKYENNPKLKRKPISQNIKDKVWNRDGGKCVECGSNEKIEFDHIIPFSKGGTDTYRNLQILCEKCNRSKSDKIG
jgi:hypothetical protein